MKFFKFFICILFSCIQINLFATEPIIINNERTYSNQTFSNVSPSGVFGVNSKGILNLQNIIFDSNENVSENFLGRGGAISAGLGKTNINSTTFENNHSTHYGGAIYVGDKSTTTINSTSFIGNSTDENGGAIYNSRSKNLTIYSTVFINNTSGKYGGAISNVFGTLNLIANMGNIEFTGNIANGISNAISDSNGITNLWASNNADIIFNDRIASSSAISYGKGEININPIIKDVMESSGTGKIVLNEDMSDFVGYVNLYGGEVELRSKTEENSNININKFFSGNVNLSSGTLNILNNAIDNITVSTWTSTANSNLKFDTDLRDNTSDNFTVINSAEGIINLTAINILGINEDNGQITLFNNENAPIINILTTGNYGGYEYTFTNSDVVGILNYEKTGTVAKTFKEYVNTAEPAIRSYSLSENETITQNLGQLGGTQLTVFGNGYEVNGNSKAGINVSNGQTLSIDKGTGENFSWNNFNKTGHGTVIFNEGTTNISQNIEFYLNTGTRWGGAIYNNNTLNIDSNVVFTSNTAKCGGAVINFGGITAISSSTFTNNMATLWGGAVENAEYGTLNITSALFSSNTATQSGGAIQNLKGTTTISSSTFIGNYAQSYGGAIANEDGGTLIISSSIFTKNRTGETGGVLKNNDGTINITLSSFNENVSDSVGGAIFNDVGTITISSSSFIKNKAESDTGRCSGGAIDIDVDGIITIKDSSSFSENRAKLGGAIENNGRATIISSLFSGNIATEVGGAIDNSNRLTIEKSVFTNNTANIGGAIENKDENAGVVLISSSLFNSNTATNIGGAIHNNENLTVTIQDGTKFINNTATTNGGAIYNEGITNLIANIDDIEFTGNTANGISNAIHDKNGTINLYASDTNSIIFNDRITSENNLSILNINSSTNTLTTNGKVVLNEDMSGYTGTTNLYNGNLKITEGNNFINGNFTIHGGTFIANANSIITGFTNNGNVDLTGGENSSWIAGTGTTVIDGSVINSSTIANSVTINENKQLTTDASNVTGNINNLGNYVLTSGKNNNWIAGTGTTIIDGEIVNSSTIVNSVTINENKQLTTKADKINGNINNLGNYILTGGENNNWIYGTGTTKIDASVINSSTIVNDVIINKNKQLTTNATNVTGNITNNGSLVFNGGINSNTITGTGITQIYDNVINQANITQNNLEILSNKQLTNSTAIVTINELLTVNNNAKIINDGKLIINNGTNNGKIEQTTNISTTTITGNFINNGTIEQNIFNIEDTGNITNKNNIFVEQLNNNGNIINNNSITTMEIANNGNIETSATNIRGNILNNGTLLFNAGIANNNQITGVGTLNITANYFINNNIIEQKIVKISKENSNVNNVASSNSQQELNNFINNSTISAEDLTLKSVNLKLTEKGLLSVQNLSSQNSEIYLANTILQEHNFKTISLTDDLNLSVDADLENKKMDTITANSFGGTGKINVKAINILNDAKENKTEILFTNSTVLKDKITTTIDTASSKLFKYDVNYDKNTGNFNFLLTAKTNPIIVESQVARATGLITQNTVLNQAFSSIDNIRNRIIQAKQKGILYASTSDVIFESNNRIESGLWIRPFYSQDTISFDSLDVDNTLTGTLAGIDLVAGENSLLSFYLGYAGSNQKYEDIKVNQTGYIVGATGMIIKEKWYAGLTANINFNKAESQSDYGTDSFDMNMYSIGAKAGYNFDLSDKWILEPNLMLMYGNVNSQEYETTQGAKIDSQSTANIIAEPQVKAKLNLTNGWQPYGLLGYLINAGEKAKLVADNIAFDNMGISGYVECGLGVNKTFKNSPWSCYLQLTGKSGDISGFDGNIGIKYSFLNKKEKEDIELIKYLKKKEKEEIKEQKKIESEKLAKQKALQEEQRRIEKEEKARLEAEEKARIEEEERLKKEEQDRQKALEQERIKAEKAEKEKQKLLEIERKIQENYN